MKKGKKVRNILSVIAILLFAGSINVSAATFSDVNRSDIFLKQDVSGSSGTCTLSSAAMLIRRAALLSGNGSWSSITESSIKSTAWTTGGLRNGFSYSGINVSSAKISSNKTQTFINLLGAHPEGIVIYDFDKPHAILLTDYTDGVFYCADPSKGAPSGRIPVSKATITVESADKYWYVSSPSLSFTNDNVMPTIQNVKIVGRAKNGFTMQCVVTDNVGVSKVQFPTWETSKTSAGCIWYDGTCVGNNTWQFTFPNAISQGWYTTHIYAWDVAGNSVSKGVDTYVDQTAPTINDISIIEVTADGYKVRCTVTDNYELDRVQFPTWTGYNGQDDIQLNWTTDVGARGVNCGNNVYEYYVKRSEHNGEFGSYATHIYAYDTTGNRTSCEAGIINLENVGPIVTDIKVTNQSVEGYTITCKVIDDQSGVARVQFPTWTKKDWQDDLTSDWNSVNAVYLGNGVYSYTVKRSEHNNEYGIYYTDIYAFDGLENMSYGGGVVIDIQPEALPNDNMETSNSPGEIDNGNISSKPTNSKTPTMSTNVQDNSLAVLTVVTYEGISYKIVKNGSTGYAQCIGPARKNIKKAKIKSYVYVGKTKYPVLQINPSAFKNCKKLTEVTINKNIKTIGAEAFYGCKKLKTIIIQSKKLESIQTKAFKGICKKAKIELPKSRKKKYKKMLKKAGVKSTVKFK